MATDGLARAPVRWSELVERRSERRSSRPPRGLGGHTRRRAIISAFERIALAAVSLAFIAVFVVTYMRADDRRSASLRATSLAAGSGAAPARSGVPGLIAAIEPPGSGGRSSEVVSAPSGPGTFSICHTGGGTNCVVDGDTAWIGGVKIRIADIDAPETHPPRCDHEAELGDAATSRLAALMNLGPFEITMIDRDTDMYGRKLRILVRNGRSIGDQLVQEGFARAWEGHRRPWC